MTPVSAATLRDVASRCGLSVSTVSRVLAGRHREVRISEEACGRVHRAAQQLGYRPHRQAQALRLKQSTTLGVCLTAVPGRSNGLIFELFAGLFRTAAENELAVITVDSENAQGDLDAIDRFAAARVRGIVFWQRWDTPQVSQRLNALRHSGTPVVVVHERDATCHCPFVGVDSQHGGYLLTQHLIGLGHRRIAYVGLVPTVARHELNYPRPRVNGYRQALVDHGLETDEQLIVGVPTRFDGGIEAVDRLWALKHPPTAIVAFNDRVALGVRRGLLQKGLQVPRDCSVVGSDATEAGAYADVPLTTVALPLADVGRRAVQAVVGQGDPFTELLLPPQLIVRASSAPPPQ